MPDAGRVSVTVDLDVDRLGDKLAAKLHEAMVPALAGIEADVNKISKILGGIDDSGLKKTKTSADSAKKAMSELKEEAGKLGSVLKLNLGVAAIGTLPALATAVVDVAGAVQQLAGAGLAIPGAFAGLASSVGVAALGIHGMKDALKDLSKAQDGTKASVEAANASLAKLPANVRDATQTIYGLKGTFDSLQAIAGNNLFAGFSQGLRELARNDLPVVARGIDGISQALNQNLRQAMQSLGSQSSQGFLERIFGNTADAQSRLTAAIDPIVHAVGTLTAAGSDALPRLADAITAVSTRFDAFITRADQNGNLSKWINDGLTGFRQLGESVLNIGKIFTGITQAAGTNGFLGTLEAVTNKWQEWVNSAQGQQQLSGYFAEGRQILGELKDVAIQLGPALGGAFEAASNATQIWLPVIEHVLEVVNALPGGAESVVNAFLLWKNMQGVTALLGALGNVQNALGFGIGKAAGDGATAVEGAAARMSAALGPISALVASIMVVTGGHPLDYLGTGPQSPGGAAQQGDWWKALFGKLGDPLKNFLAPTPDTSVVAPGSLFGPFTPEGPRPGAQAERRGGVPPGYGLPPWLRLPNTPVPGISGYTPPVITDFGKAGTGPEFPKFPELPVSERPLVVQTPEQEKLLEDIRALLQGTGNTGAPLNSLKDLKPAVSEISSDLKKMVPASAYGPGTIPEHMGPFGTPIKARNPGYDTAAAVISALGGNPEQFIGENPVKFAEEQWQNKVDDWKTKTDHQIEVWQQSAEWQEKLDNYQQQVLEWQLKMAQRGLPGVPGTGTTPGAPGAAAPFPGLGAAGTAGLAPAAAAGGDQASIAKLIAGMAAQRGYDAHAQQAIVAYALGESSLNPRISGGVQGGDEVIGLFQEKQAFSGGLSREQRMDPVANINAYLNQLEAHRNLPIEQALPATSVGGPLASGPGSAPQDWNRLFSQAGALLGSPGGQLPISPAGVSTNVGVPALGGNAAALISFAQTYGSGSAQYAPASDLVHGLADCSGAVSDLVELLTQGTTSPSRLFTTHNEGQVLQSLGAVPGLIPGALQIGFNEGHTAATLPNGVNFESGGNAGGPTYGGSAAGANSPQFTQHYSLPVSGSGSIAGLPNFPQFPSMALSSGGGTVPVYVTNWPGTKEAPQGGLPGGSIIDAAFGSAGSATSGAAGNVIDAIANVGLEDWRKRQPNASLADLANQGNPLALAAATGFNVEDFTRQGGNAGAASPDQPFDASGRVFSDTSTLIDRTFTSLTAQLDAMRQQLLDVLNQVRQAVSEEVLKPIIQAAIDSAFRELSSATQQGIGTALGQAAAPPIAAAVQSAIPPPSSGGDSAGGAIGNLVGGLFDEGGEWPSGTIGANFSGGTEYVLTPSQYTAAKMGQFATVSGVVGNATVGAEFFGLSQVPILGFVINILVEILLAIIGVEIKVRDTLQELTGEFRTFRGDTAKYFTAEGQMLNDTSALIERSLSSSKAATDERVSILGQVISGTIKYVITQVVIPIGKAVANAAIQAGASAAGAAINTQAPGAGGIVSALISSAGQAGVEIAGDIGTAFANAAVPVLTDAVLQGTQGLFPNLIQGIFSGKGLATLFDPVGKLLASILGAGAIGPGVWGSVGGLFDEGGVAYGTGLMPKATIKPERVLSPRETLAFERLVAAMETGHMRGNTVIHAPFTVVGGQSAGEQAHDRLLSLLS